MVRVFWIKSCQTGFFALILLILISCMGTSSQIAIESDGSGSIILEYIISDQLENLGGLDGNHNRLPIPAGRIDFERSVARVPGLALVSYSSRQNGNDIIHRAELAFASPDALTAFLDSSGRYFQFDFPGRKLVISFYQTRTIDTTFREFTADILKEYYFSISFSVPGTANAQWLDGDGRIINHFPGDCIVLGRAVRYTVSMTELVFLESPLYLEISWE